MEPSLNWLACACFGLLTCKTPTNVTWPPLKPSVTSKTANSPWLDHLRCRILLKTVSPLNGEKFFNTRDAK